MKIETVEELKNVYEQEQQKLDNIAKQVSWKNPQAYVQWLADSYEYAFNSTRILAMAGATMPPNRTKFSNRFIAHSAEEKGHERLLENDAKGFGINISNVEVSHEMKVFHQSLYYWLSSFASPIGLFGWVLALEGFAVRNGEWIYEQCLEAHGKKCTSFLRVHSSEDPDHLEKAFQTVNELDKTEVGIVAEALKQYSVQYGAILQGISPGELQKVAA